MQYVLEILKQVGKSLLAALLTEAFIKKLIVWGLKKIAAKTDNDVDDELVKQVEEALYPPDQK